MPLRKQKVSLKFAAGMHDKIDEKLLPREALVSLENSRFDKIGAINKRKGYDYIDKNASDIMSHNDALIARNIKIGNRGTSGIVDQAKAYSPSSGEFTGNHGYSDGHHYTFMPVSRGSEAYQMNSNVAISADGKWALVTFIDVSFTTKRVYTKRCSLVDRETNTLVASDIFIGASHATAYEYSGNYGRKMKAVWLVPTGATQGKFYIWHEHGTTTSNTAIRVSKLDPTESVIQLRNLANTVSDTGTETFNSTAYPMVTDGTTLVTSGGSFDVCSSSTANEAHIYLSYNDGGTYEHRYYRFQVTGETSYNHDMDREDAACASTNTLNSPIYIHRCTIPGVDSTNKLAVSWSEDVSGGSNIWTTLSFAEEADSATRVNTALLTYDYSIRVAYKDDVANGDVGGAYQKTVEAGMYESGINSTSAPSYLYGLNDVHGDGVLTANSPLGRTNGRLAFVLGRGPHSVGCFQSGTGAMRDPAIGSFDVDVTENPINTIELLGVNRKDTVVAGDLTLVDTPGISVYERDYLPIGSYSRDWGEDIHHSDIYNGGTLALEGEAVAVPIGHSFGRFGTSGEVILNSTVQLFDFRRYDDEVADIPMPSTATLNDITYIADKALFQYDGTYFFQPGFVDRPMFSIRTKLDSSDGTMAAGVYFYKAVYEWVDAQGNLHQGEPSDAVTWTSPGNDGEGGTVGETALLMFDVLNLPNHPPRYSHDVSFKEGYSVAIYRTPANSSVYQHLTTLSLGSYYQTDIQYEDNALDTVLETGKYLYTDGGQLINTRPPASARYVIAHRQRLFVIGKDDVVYYSKIAVDGYGIGFHPALQIRTPANKSDPPTALGAMDGNLFIFCKKSIYIVSGEGPDNNGTGGFYDTKRIPTSVGAVEGSPVLLMAEGLMFVSDRGIFLLGRNMAVSHIGAPVENLLRTGASSFYGGKWTVKDMILSPEDETVYITVSNGSEGRIVTYNFEQKQWGYDLPRAASDFQSDGSMASSDGKIYFAGWQNPDVPVPRVYFQKPDVYTDTTYAGQSYVNSRIRTAWINLAGIQSYQRVYNFHILGTIEDAATLRVNVYYDYDNLTLVNTYTFSTSDTSGVLQFRGHLSKQKCQAIQFHIMDEDNDGSTDSGFTISEIELEIGIKSDGYKDSNAKLSTTSTIGSAG